MSVIMKLQQARNPEQIADALEPLAQAMAAIADETREAMIEQRTQSEAARQRTEELTRAAEEAVKRLMQGSQAQQAAAEKFSQTSGMWLIAACGLAGLFGGVLAVALWLWLAPQPPRPSIQLDPEAVADRIIEGMKRPPSKFDQR